MFDGGMEDVESELEAMEAVYGSDCRVLQRWPPQVEILLKPRTADELPLQFVEIVLSIKASNKYPSEPPKFELELAKGLDVARQIKLIAALDLEADQLCNEPMLVTVTESAVDFLTTNNYPEGDCSFCLFPLMDQHEPEPYMKLMSCFHCFHSGCFSNWWKWLPREASAARCPVCRAEIQHQDVAHVKEIFPSSSASKRSDQALKGTTRSVHVHVNTSSSIVSSSSRMQRTPFRSIGPVSDRTKHPNGVRILQGKNLHD